MNPLTSSLSDFWAPSEQRVRYTVWINLDGRPMAGVLLPMRRFHPMDRDTDLLLPLSVQDWLSKGRLARYVVEVVEGFDLSVLMQMYGGTGSTPYHPAMLLASLIDGYATGRFSSRKIERATYDSLAFRFIACNLHSDHDALATLRRCFRKEFEAAFVQVLEVARENRFSRFGSVCLDGAKIHANASRYSVLSYGHTEALEAHLRAEVQDWRHHLQGPDTGSTGRDDQINLTDDESRIMPVAGGGFEQCYNAQAMVDPGRMLVVVPKVVQAVNDKQQVLPMLAQLQALPAGLNGAKRLADDVGYFSKDNVAACDAAGIELLIAVTRDQHHPH